MKSFIPWVGGKSKLLWLIHKLSPSRYSRFIDVFGGSGTVTLSRPIQQGCMEVYNDFNGDLTNLFCCVKNRTMALLLELGFLPLNTRDDFNVLYKFFSREEFTDDYLDEEMELTQRYLEPPDAKTIRRMMLERAPRGDVRRAADYFKLIRYSFSGGAKSFAGKSCDIRRFFHLVWECSRRLAEVVIENKDCVDLIRQYDREDAFFYVKDDAAVVDEMFQTDELSRYLARLNLTPQWKEGVFDRLAAGEAPGEELGQPQKGCRIWQLRKGVDVTMRFIGYEDLIQRFGEPDADNYTQVFEGDLGTNDLERIYAICRDSPPPGYRGYRMALSDVVELYDASGSEFYYCDRVGFRPIQFSQSQEQAECIEMTM